MGNSQNATNRTVMDSVAVHDKKDIYLYHQQITKRQQILTHK